MEKATTTNNTLKIVYTYNGKELVLGDVLREHITNKDLNIAAWKAIQFFEATTVDRTPVAA